MSGATERLPYLAALGLALTVGVVALLPMLRDPSALDALEGVGTGDAATLTKPGGGATSRELPEKKKQSPPPPTTASQAEVDAATTLELLASLTARFPEDPKVLAKLAKAQAADPNGLVAAVATLRKLFSLDEQAVRDVDLQGILKRAASGSAQASDLAFDVMANSMGSAGIDLMYELGVSPGTSKLVRDRSISLTKRDDIRKKASPALLVALDLRGSVGCARKKDFARAAEVGDARSLQYLTPLTATKGCGVFGLGDCFDDCLGNRKELRDTISAIKARGG